MGADERPANAVGPTQESAWADWQAALAAFLDAPTKATAKKACATQAIFLKAYGLPAAIRESQQRKFRVKTDEMVEVAKLTAEPAVA